MSNDVILDWDPRKRIQNLTCHGLDFQDLVEFNWGANSPRRSDRHGEERYVELGDFRGKPHVVVYTVRNGVVRIISFRRAKTIEVSRYANP